MVGAAVVGAAVVGGAVVGADVGAAVVESSDAVVGSLDARSSGSASVTVLCEVHAAAMMERAKMTVAIDREVEERRTFVDGMKILSRRGSRENQSCRDEVSRRTCQTNCRR